MGTARLTPAPPRAVLDTNPVLSALVFSTGNLVTLRREWQSRRFTPLVSKATAGELIRVLAYPKFRLKAEEREDLLSDHLPFARPSRCSIRRRQLLPAATRSTWRSSSWLWRAKRISWLRGTAIS